ncbi:MAG: hypothetical protein K2Q10_02805 [Rhodospirillales bacterium]|nr:hypothetical protein [Rhodospirillales bacterium]
MTIQEFCYVFITVAFVAGVASLIHAKGIENRLNLYSLARWQREEEEKKVAEEKS